MGACNSPQRKPGVGLVVLVIHERVFSRRYAYDHVHLGRYQLNIDLLDIHCGARMSY